MANIEYTDFIRTSEKRHERAVHHLWVSISFLCFMCCVIYLLHYQQLCLVLSSSILA